MKQLRITLLVVVIVSFVGVSVGSAQGKSLVRFGNFTSTEDQVELYWQGLLLDVALSPNVMTEYMPADVGEQTVTFAPSEGTTEDILPAAETVTIQEGHTYSIILTGANSIPVIVDETGMDEELQRTETENRLTIVMPDAARDGSQANAVVNERILSVDDLESGFEPGNTAIVSLLFDRTNQDILDALDERIRNARSGDEAILLTAQRDILAMSRTNSLINGNALRDPNMPLFLNLSTELSVADLLAQVSQMPNAPFSFNHFLETATTGGFYAALEQCENYMWNVFTDEAFEALTPEQQSYVRGTGAATVMDSSVLQQATTTPWSISPTTTRGGTPLTYNPPLQVTANDTSSSTQDNVVSGSIFMTISTTGNDVQNVIHITDTVPVGGDAQNFQTPREIRYNTRFRF